MPERTVVKKVKNAVLYSDGTVRLDNVRASYAHVYVPQEERDDDGNKTGKQSYSIQCLMDKKTHKEAKDLLVEIINNFLKEKKVKALPSDRKFIRDGDQSGKDEQSGMWCVSTRETKRPSLRDAKKRRLDPEEPKDRDVIYSGCYVNVLIRPWWQDNKYGKRANAGISAVQFYRDGEPFESRVREEDIDDTFDDHGGADADEWSENDDEL